ncbi:type VI secretion system tip protein VgrG [Lysobacter sp. GX 14042]|uniref:type VI secretion system Vgr family protein n=1 Tax=Lysobacter sp. GX 14042 TaxID=2907155 RepID=UPI001F458821|nr:type VI secretion system Vgr family protein [Lysobacter sp. GX 14042]MCE7031995.1 type VI secretion system tip protein VgrG [Lysobacter sp. GX 14042]
MDSVLSRLPAAVPGALPSQRDRLVEIDTGPGNVFVAERFSGREAVCEDFRFQVDCLSTHAFLDPGPLLGRAVTLRLRRADGRHRHWHGHCTRVLELGSDGGLARYRLVVEPWTAFLHLRRNALIFQDLDALDVLERILDDYPQAALRVDVGRTLPRPPVTTQYRESDHAFVFRLLAGAGLAWRFEHAQAAIEDGAPLHTLVVYDQDADAVAADPPALRFHRSDITEAHDAISHFAEQRQATANAVTAASWQPDQVEAMAASVEAGPAGPHLPAREVYEVPGSGRFEQRDQAETFAGLRLDALRLPRRLHAGAGSGRGLAAGAVFTLLQHPGLSGQQFVPLAVEHVAANNLGSGIVELLDAPDLERGSYRNRFLAVPAATAIVPNPVAKPTAAGMQTARVVGLPDTAVTSTRDHQVRIQFPWQRGPRPNPGGLADTGSAAFPDGHAPGDHTSGTWVRVAEWVAGPNWGSHALPRIGSEVLVEFLHGDIDRPVITGQLYNGAVAPPFALADASNHPGTIAGLHTQSLDGGGTQQWLVDDATGQLRQRLHTSLADSRLELGYLVEHDNATRGGLRGQGFDFATLGWANLRAARGVLLSTTARPGATSTQLDANEAVAQLRGAELTAQALSDAAEGSGVAPLTANTAQSDFVAAVDPEQDGRYAGAIAGQPATKPAGDQRQGGAPVECFARPVLLAESPDAIALATDASAVAHASGNLHITAQQDLHLVAGQTFAGVSGGHLALFAQRGPLKAIAANGPLSLQAHAGPLELLADRSVSITATDERIDVLAKEKIVLQAGQARVTLEGGDITFACPGTFTVKAGQLPFKGGNSGDVRLSLPDGLLKLEPDRMLDFSG